MKKKCIQNILVFLTITFLAACSPYIYQSEVSKFNEGIQSSAATFDEQRKFLAQVDLNIFQEDLIDDGYRRVSIPEKCIEVVTCLERLSLQSVAGKACATKFLEQESLTGDVEPPPDDYMKLANIAATTCKLETEKQKNVERPLQLQTQKLVLDGLTAYGTALAGIVNAEDRKALDASTTEACSSTKTLFGTVSSISTNKTETADNLTPEEQAALEKQKAQIANQQTAIGSVCGLVGTIGAAILDTKRLKTLKQVVNAADPNISILTNYLRDESRKINTIIIRHEFSALNDALYNTSGLVGNRDRYLSAVDTAVNKKSDFHRVLLNDPYLVYSQMGIAHKKLKASVNDPNTQLEAAIEAIKNFSSSAKKALEAIRALSDEEE